MYALPRTNYVKRSLLVNMQKPNTHQVVFAQSEPIKEQLVRLGLGRMARLSMESRYLPHIIQPDEKLEAVVYGRSPDGMAMLVATDKRAIFLDKKPLFVNEDEVTYDVVSGVDHSHLGMGSTVILHTRVKDYRIQTMNHRCAQNFVKAIETRCINNRRIDKGDSL